MWEPFLSAGTEKVSSDTSGPTGNVGGSMLSGRVTHEIPYRAQDRAVSTFGDPGLLIEKMLFSRELQRVIETRTDKGGRHGAGTRDNEICERLGGMAMPFFAAYLIG
jgi:hypothetical protein